MATQATPYRLPSSEPTGESSGKCTLGSFSLPSVKHRRQPTGSSHLTDVCTLDSFPLSGTKHKLQPTGRLDLNRIVALLRVPSLFGVDASNLSMGRTSTSGPYQVHSSADGTKSPLERNRDPLPPLRFSHSEAQLRC